jgi:hypothetical protein
VEELARAEEEEAGRSQGSGVCRRHGRGQEEARRRSDHEGEEVDNGRGGLEWSRRRTGGGSSDPSNLNRTGQVRRH